MCGRYLITSAPEAIRALFRYLEEPDFPPRYNVAPTQPVPIVRINTGARSFALVRWGLIPSWVKDPRNFALLNNARGETVNEKPAFQNAMRRRRCLFPADGFYEWRADGAHRRPYLVRPHSGGPIAFAGLWETWIGPNGEEVETACIVTTTANRGLAPIHDRMPVVIAPEAFDLWLDCARVDATTAAALIVPAPDNLFEAYEISTAVNGTANDSAALIEPVGRSATTAGSAAAERPYAKSKAILKVNTKKDDGQASLF
ncbi:MAG TPA: SOS response-associated peptidase [Xanthobacteraceae bacterium]|nr:SOS response-associated peptidase [Xanthobacteraceae bacterium]